LKEKKGTIGRTVIICACAIFVLLISANTGMSEERNLCILIVDKDGKHEIDNKDYVELTLDKNTVKSMRVHTKAAHTDVKYSNCRILESDGSNFAKWFSVECRSIKAHDGKSAASLELYFADSYVGISPVINPKYAMYKKLKDVADGLGLDVPARTFVIYAERKPIFEFFCYPAKEKEK